MTYLDRRLLVYVYGKSEFLVIDWNEKQWEPVQDELNTDERNYDQSYLDEEERKRLARSGQELPEGRHVPIGGANTVWKTRRHLGYSTGNCTFIDSVEVQSFENGRLLGPVWRKSDDSRAFAIVLFEDEASSHALFVPANGVTAPRCGTGDGQGKDP